uniref:TGc domain-containing protein n=1 Tax=Macrostomum lignano TaxID=282301 RepID=A0A1I8HD28_9PLAT
FARISQENLTAGQQLEEPPQQQKTPSKMSLRDKIKTFEASSALSVASDVASASPAPVPAPTPPRREQRSAEPAARAAAETYANLADPPARQQRTTRPSPPPIPKPRGSLENLADAAELHYANLQHPAPEPPPPTAPRTSAGAAKEDPRYHANVQHQPAEDISGTTLHYATSEVALNLAGLGEEDADRAMRVYEHHEETVSRELQRRSQEVSQAAIDAEFSRYNQAVKRRSRESPTLPQRSPFATLASSSGRTASGPRTPSLERQQQQPRELETDADPAEAEQQPRYRKHGGTLDGRQDPAAEAFARAKRISKSLGPKERRQKKTKSAELADQSYRGVDLEAPPPRPPQRQARHETEEVAAAPLKQNQRLRPPLPPPGRHSQHDMQQLGSHDQQPVQYANLASHQRARSMDLLEEPRLPVDPDSHFNRGRGGGPASVASSMLSVNVANKDSEELAQLLEQYLKQKRDQKIQRMLLALKAQDPAKHRLLMERYKDELQASSMGYATSAASLAVPPVAVRGGHPLAASTATLLNNLEPGVTNVMLGPEGTLREAASMHTMLHPTEPARTVVWDPSQPEVPPPAMRPPPKPMPPGLSKTVPPDGWKAVDDHVMEILDVDCNTFAEQVNSLCGRYQSDVEKCRAIFRFLTARLVQPLVYDPQAPPTTLIGCLRMVQAGEVSPHELFKRMCAHAGIHCEILHGYSKGAGYRPGMNLKDNRMFRNTWTAVYVEGCWRFVNVAWGGRRLAKRSGATELRLKCDDFYFLTEPEEHIYEHWPDDRRWQLLRTSVTLSHFMRLPMLKSPFFNAGLRLKKGKYDDTLMTQNGRVSLKIGVTKFVGVSCQLQNRADMSSLRGKTLARLIGEALHVLASPAQPGTYFLNIFVSPDWTSNEHELAASFQVKCAENNFDRLALGRYPEVGFLGATPAAQQLGISFLTSHGAKTPMDPYVVHTAKELLRLPVAAAPGLKVAHQMKCYQRSGVNTEQCDSYALLQCRGKQQA